MGIIRDIQNQHKDWANQNFENQEKWEYYFGLVEEIGELFHSCLKRHQKIRGSYELHTLKMKDALADIFIYMCGLANIEGFDLEDIIVKTWDEDVKIRDWNKNPDTGKSDV